MGDISETKRATRRVGRGLHPAIEVIGGEVIIENELTAHATPIMKRKEKKKFRKKKGIKTDEDEQLTSIKAGEMNP